MIFFFDENISLHAPRMLEAFDPDNQCHHLTQHFEKGTPDEYWMREIACWEDKPVVVSGDGRILQNKAQRLVLRESNLSMIVLRRAWQRASWHTQAWKYVKVWPDVLRDVERATQPTYFELSFKSPKLSRVRIIS